MKEQRPYSYGDGDNEAIEHIAQKWNLGEDVDEVCQRWSRRQKACTHYIGRSFERAGEHPQEWEDDQHCQNRGQNEDPELSRAPDQATRLGSHGVISRAQTALPSSLRT